MKVLIIDDSRTARMFSKKCVQMALSSCELEFCEAVDGEDAIQTLRKNNDVGLIVSDVNMPVMSGFTFLRNIKMDDAFKDIPIVFVTSLANEARVDNLLGLGALGVISKPMRPNEFKKILDASGFKCTNDDSNENEGWG